MQDGIFETPNWKNKDSEGTDSVISDSLTAWDDHYPALFDWHFKMFCARNKYRYGTFQCTLTIHPSSSTGLLSLLKLSCRS